MVNYHIGEKDVAMQTRRHCPAHCKPETKKTGDSGNACVCFHMSLKLSTDDNSDFVAVKLKTDYMLLSNLRFN